MLLSNLTQIKPKKVLIESSKLENFQFATKKQQLHHPMLTSWLRLDEARGVFSSYFLQFPQLKQKVKRM